LGLIQDREKRTNRIENSGISEEELIKFQEEMFEKARQRLASGTAPESEASKTADSTE
jgi:hypothetical protein